METQWKTTVIVSSSIQNHDTCRMLRAQQHRIRLSDSITAGAFIFPSSGTAFLLTDPRDFPERVEDQAFIEEIQNFVQVHRNCFLLLYAPFSGPKELQSMNTIQSRFFGSNLKILPVQTNADVVKGMLTIVKATSKPHRDSIRDRMSVARSHIIESSPMWEMLRDRL